MIKQVTNSDPKILKKCVFFFFQRVHVQQILGPIEEKKRLRQDCWGYGPCKNDLKIDGIVEIIDSGRFGDG